MIVIRRLVFVMATKLVVRVTEGHPDRLLTASYFSLLCPYLVPFPWYNETLVESRRIFLPTFIERPGCLGRIALRSLSMQHAARHQYDVFTKSSVFSERELTFTCSRSRSLKTELLVITPVRPSVVCLSVCRLSVGNARAPYSDGWHFRQYFYCVRYPGHPLTSIENFTEIVPGEPLRRGVKPKRGSQV